MPIVWRFLLNQYLKVLFFCTIAFIAVLLTTRLDDIAHFATLGAGSSYVLLFTLYQIPYVLPIAIPISGLISALILIQRLSNTHEITALRSAGMSLSSILTPIFIAAGFLSCVNFYIVSELATQSHLATGLLKNEIRSINPLLLLHNKHLMRLKGFYFESLGPSQLGESASDVIIAMPSKQTERLNIMVAKQLKSASQEFVGTDVTLIASVEKSEAGGFDSLMLENVSKNITSIADFSQIIQKKVWTIHDDYLRLPLLLTRIQEEMAMLDHVKEHHAELSDGESKLRQEQIQRNINKGQSEITRRISVALSTFTFTFMGAAFGVGITRRKSRKSTFFVIGLATLYLTCYFIAKAVDYQFWASSAFYLMPHAILIALSVWVLRRASKGVE